MQWVIVHITSPHHDLILITQSLPTIAIAITITVDHSVLDNDILIPHRLELRLRHLKHVLSKMLHSLHRGPLNVVVQRARGREHLPRRKHELVRALQKEVKRGLQLVTGREHLAPAEDVEAQTCA